VNDEFIPGSVGRVTIGTEIKFTDIMSGNTIGPYFDGEICVRKRDMFVGYLNNDEAYEEAFDRDGWYKSGDLGHYDDKGRIYLKGRLKEAIRIGIEEHYKNLSPEQMEETILMHQGKIEDVAVVGVTNKFSTQWPRAYVVLKKGKTATVEDINKFAQGRE